MKNGFTLVELLAVIVIIALLGFITSISVASVIRTSKNKLQQSQQTIIKDAVGMWLTENLDYVPTGNNCIYVTLGELKEYGTINQIKDLEKIEDLSDETIIRVDAIDGKKYDIEIDTDDYEGCTKIYE